jgi:sugar-specific transcriptional regulator TrmB
VLKSERFLENSAPRPASDIEEKVSDLTSFGLTPLQAKMYIRLLMLGPSFAKDLGALLGISRVDTYRILRGLRKRGLLEVLISEPSKYVAIEAATAVEILVSEREKQVSNLKQRSPKIIAWLDSVTNSEKSVEQITDDSSVTHFRLKYGIQMVDSLRRLARKSENEILKIWSAPGLVFHSEQGLLQDFQKAAEKGVKIKGLVEINDDNVEDIRYLARFASIRSAKDLSTTLRYTIADHKEVLVNATQAPLEEAGVMAFWTDNPAIVHGFVEDFTRKWQHSLPVKLND